MPQPFWNDALSEEWQKMLVAGHPFPGIVEFGGSVEADLEVKKAKGSDKSTTKNNGYKLAEISVTLQIADEAAWNDLQSLLADIYPRGPGKKRNPVEIVHPAINVLGLTRFQVKRINVPQIGRGGREHGIATISINLLEWAPAPKPVKSGNVSAARQIKLAESQSEVAKLIGPSVDPSVTGITDDLANEILLSSG